MASTQSESFTWWNHTTNTPNKVAVQKSEEPNTKALTKAYGKPSPTF
jgi:hypothetical protein